MTPKQETIAIIRGVAARHPGVTVDQILGRDKARRVCVPRHLAIVEIRKAKPRMSLGDIGRVFDRDHSTIHYVLSKYGALE